MLACIAVDTHGKKSSGDDLELLKSLLKANNNREIIIHTSETRVIPSSSNPVNDFLFREKKKKKRPAFLFHYPVCSLDDSTVPITHESHLIGSLK